MSLLNQLHEYFMMVETKLLAFTLFTKLGEKGVLVEVVQLEKLGLYC